VVDRRSLALGKAFLALALCLALAACSGTSEQVATAPVVKPKSRVDVLSDHVYETFQAYSITGTLTRPPETMRSLLVVASTPDLDEIEAAVLSAVKRAREDDVDTVLNRGQTWPKFDGILPWFPSLDYLSELLIEPAPGSPRWSVLLERDGQIFIPGGYGWNGSYSGLNGFLSDLRKLKKSGRRRDITSQLRLWEVEPLGR
jgi:hypothetical protein